MNSNSIWKKQSSYVLTEKIIFSSVQMPKNIQAKNSQYDEVQKIKTLKNVMLLEKELFCIVQDKP